MEIFGIQLLTIHLGTLAFLVLMILVAEHEGMLWMKGKKEVLKQKKIEFLHGLVLIGLALMIMSGFAMFWPLREYLLYHPPFQAKMIFVLALIINSFFIGKLSKVTAEKRFSDLSKSEKLPLYISGVVSSLSWAGAIISALLMNI